MIRVPALLLLCLLLCAFPYTCFAQTGVTWSVFPQIAGGDGWSFDIFLINQGDNTANGVRLSFFTGRGEPLVASTDLGSNSTFTFSLAGGTTRSIRAADTGSLRSGYAALETPSDSSIRGSLVIRWLVGGQAVTQLGVTQQSVGTSYTFPVEVDVAAGLNTGLALAVPTMGGSVSGTSNIVVNLLDEGGNLQESIAIPIVIGGHQASYFDQIFTGLTTFRGSASVSSTVPLGLIALRQEQSTFGTLAVNRGPVVAPFRCPAPIGAEFEPNNTTGQATPLVLPARFAGAISSAGDIDLYAFAGKAGDIVTALTDSRPFGSTADTVLALMRGDGSVIFSNDQNGLQGSNDSFLQTVLSASGIYFLRVQERTGNGGGNYGYELHVRILGRQPFLNLINPSSAVIGTTVGITITGTNLAGATAINFSPATGITISNIVASASQMTASLTVAGTAPTGQRQVTVTTPNGTSNALNFSLNLPPPSGQAPVITNLSVGTPSLSGGFFSVSVSFDFADPDADILYYAYQHPNNAKLQFSKTGCTQQFSGSLINKPGQTSGQIGVSIQSTGYISGNYTISVNLIDSAGNTSNTLIFNITVWTCFLVEPEPRRDPRGGVLPGIPGLFRREAWTTV